MQCNRYTKMLCSVFTLFSFSSHSPTSKFSVLTSISWCSEHSFRLRPFVYFFSGNLFLPSNTHTQSISKNRFGCFLHLFHLLLRLLIHLFVILLFSELSVWNTQIVYISIKFKDYNFLFCATFSWNVLKSFCGIENVNFLFIFWNRQHALHCSVIGTYDKIQCDVDVHFVIFILVFVLFEPMILLVKIVMMIMILTFVCFFVRKISILVLLPIYLV